MNTLPVILLPLTLLMLAAPALAQTQTTTLEAALARAAGLPSVQLAVQEQRDARTDLARVLADPLSTRLDRLQAQQRADLADARAARAPKTARAQIASAYASTLSGEGNVPLATQAQALAERALRVAQLRLNNGGGNAQSVRDAEDALEDARKNLTVARAGLLLTRGALADLVGPLGQLQAPTSLPPAPSAEVVAQVLRESPNLLQARQSVVLSEFRLGLTDPSYTARRDIEVARSAVETARKTQIQVQIGERQGAQGLFDALTRASREQAQLRQAATTASAKVQSDRRRLAGGLISPLDLQQSELGAGRATAAAERARNDYLSNYYGLLAGGGAATIPSTAQTGGGS
ncbi:TolC family protein [Deinococcus koreensis]|uniref:TolC family protein n=1 Tax=Deinococcus koreensis TaxID=2054903 RepID=A0A2K3UT57_9DEIO|nr:TolC family protein [Deinococcus koreensis]PNY79717.1 TolC family protein [Deinococcus koreensis]